MKKLLAIGLLLASFSAQAVDYQVQQLPSISTVNYSIAYGINDNGTVVGSSWNSTAGILEAVVWDNGVAQSLGFEGLARAVNNSGTVVGETGGGDLRAPNGTAFKWDSTNGYVDLGNLGGGGSANASGAYDINESGVITGFSMTPNIPVGEVDVYGLNGFRYANGVMTNIGTIAPNGYSRGHSINDSGEIVGRASLINFQDSEKHLARWDSANNLTSVANSGSSIYSTGQAINNHGQIVGNGIDSNGDWLGMVWDSSNNFLYWLDTFGGNESRAWSINDDGIIVGYGTNASNQRHALISLDGGATSIDLNTLVLDLSGWQSLTEAYDINEQGQIVGYGILDNGEWGAFVATVVPVPAAVWMFLSALGVLIGLRRAR